LLTGSRRKSIPTKKKNFPNFFSFFFFFFFFFFSSSMT